MRSRPPKISPAKSAAVSSITGAPSFAGPWPRLEKIRIAETPRNIFEIRTDEIE